MSKRDRLNDVLTIMVKIEMISIKSAIELAGKCKSDSNLYHEIKEIIWCCRHTHTEHKFEEIEEIRLHLNQYK